MRVNIDELQTAAVNAQRRGEMIPTHPDVALALINEIRKRDRFIKLMQEHHKPVTGTPVKVCAVCVDENGDRVPYPCLTRMPEALEIEEEIHRNSLAARVQRAQK